MIPKKILSKSNLTSTLTYTSSFRMYRKSWFKDSMSTINLTSPIYSGKLKLLSIELNILKLMDAYVVLFFEKLVQLFLNGRWIIYLNLYINSCLTSTCVVETEVLKLRNLIIHSIWNIPSEECVHCVSWMLSQQFLTQLKCAEFRILMFYGGLFGGFLFGVFCFLFLLFYIIILYYLRKYERRMWKINFYWKF